MIRSFMFNDGSIEPDGIQNTCKKNDLMKMAIINATTRVSAHSRSHFLNFFQSVGTYLLASSIFVAADPIFFLR